MTTATAVEIPELVERLTRTATRPRRRSRRPDGEEEQGGTPVLIFLGEKSLDGGLISVEKFNTEDLAMIEALKSEVPFDQVEVWTSRAMANDGSVEIEKEPSVPT